MNRVIILGCLFAVISCNNSQITRETIKKDTVAAAPVETTQQSDADRIARLTQSIDMKVFDKGVAKIEGKDFTKFDIKITNKSDQVITAVKGRFVVANAFGDHLKNYNLKFDDANIKPGQTIKITRYWGYDKAIQEDQKIKQTPLSKLDISYQPEMVLYADGSKLQ
jgi:hypothetical protein